MFDLKESPQQLRRSTFTPAVHRSAILSPTHRQLVFLMGVRGRVLVRNKVGMVLEPMTPISVSILSK
jgi:hypothetical protein